MKVRRNIGRRRSAEGVFLVEILIAMLIGAAITISLLQIYGQLMRSASSSQNDQYANLVAQAIFERIQRIPYSTLESWQDSARVVKLNLKKTDSSAYAFQNTDIPTSLDFSSLDLKWDDKTYNARLNEDLAKATISVEPGPDASNNLRVILKLTWGDSQNQSRTLVFGTVVQKSGTKQWPL